MGQSTGALSNSMRLRCLASAMVRPRIVRPPRPFKPLIEVPDLCDVDGPFFVFSLSSS